jgi:hypothetical protein
MVHPSWKLANLRRRVNRARNFPHNTCPSSRHVHMMADYLIRYGKYQMLIDEPKHCGESMLVVLEALWKARTKLAKPKE